MILSLLSGYDRVIPRRHSVLPICEGILITPQGFRGTNLEATICTEYPGMVESPVVVDLRLLMDSLKQIRGIFEARVEGWFLILKTETREFKIPGMGDAEEFPKVPEFNPEYKMTVPEITGMIPFAGDNPDYKPQYVCVYIEPGTVSATDANVLRTANYDHGNNPDNPGILIPLNMQPFMKEPRVIEYNYELCRIYLPCRTTVLTRVIQERYPDFRNVIPRDNPNHFRLNRVELIRELDSAMLYGNKTTFQVKFSFLINQLEISAVDIDYNMEYRGTMGSEMVSGEPMEIGFNAKFLRKLLMNMEGETVTMEMSTPNRACLLMEGDSTFLVMPVMLKNPEPEPEEVEEEEIEEEELEKEEA